MPRRLTLAEVDAVARHMVPSWWDSLRADERLNLVRRYNESQQTADLAGNQKEARAVNLPPDRISPLPSL
jgi:hypothetical protein